MWSDCSPISVHHDKVSSVIDKFPPEVAQNILKNLVKSIKNVSKTLETQEEVDWTLEVLMHGLRRVDVGDEDCLLECVNVYCDWMSVLLPYPSSNIPKIIMVESNHMSRKMMRQLYLLFTGVNTLMVDTELEAACIKVLQMLESVAHHSSALQHETWDTLLTLLLGATDLILAPPGPGKDHFTGLSNWKAIKAGCRSFF